MNWDAISAIGEMIGAIGVIVSLVYLAVQVRQGSLRAADSSAREVFIGIGGQLHYLTEESNPSVFLKGLMDYRALSKEEKVIFDSLLTGMLTLAESASISNSADLLSDETMENWAAYVRPRLLPYPGFRDWWEDSRGVFLKATTDWIDAEMAKVDPESDFWGIKDRK